MRSQPLFCAAGACLLATLLAIGPPDGAMAQESRQGQGTYQIELGLSNLTVEEIDELLARAAAARLRIERDAVVSEIEADLLYEESDKAKAIRILADRPADTQDDNIGRICRAFAAVDEEFAEGYRLFSAGKYDIAVKRTRPILDPQQVTYLSAACHYVHAEALFRLGGHDEAVETYKTILTIMPDRISFASASASRCAEAYEKMNRFLYAAQAYVYCIQNYSLTMSDKELQRIAERLKYLKAIYSDPLGAAADRMGDVTSRLKKLDSGEQTRAKQKEIAAILEDMIKSAEEQQKSGGGQSQQSSGNQQRKKGQPQGSEKSQPKGGRASGRPTSPARRGFLPPGIAQRPGDSSRARPAKGSDDWARLPQSERDQIDEAARKLLPEQYRKLIEDYRKQLSKTPAAGEE